MAVYLGTNLIAGVTTTVDKSERIGQIIQSTIPLVDAGLHLLDGALIQGGGIYDDFVDYIADIYDANASYFCSEANWQSAVTTYGVCGKFVYDSVNNTVRLPKITGFTEGTIDPTTLGDLVEAGLPNLVGSFQGFEGSYSGIVSSLTAKDGSPSLVGGSSPYPKTVNINASTYNSIYGNSNTVQPQSIKVLYYIVIATSTKTDIQVDIDEIVTDLNGKADVDLTNCTKPHIVETYVNGVSWYRVYSDGWCEQGGRYLIQTNGIGTINFLKTFRDTNYAIFNCKTSSDSSTWNVMFNTTPDWTASSITIKANLTGYQLGGSWMACGYIS